MNAVSRLVTTTGHDLPLQACHVEAHAHLGLATVTLRQVFFNPTDAPAEVRYLLPLPPDAAVGAFQFTVAGRRVVGQIAAKEDARARYAEAMLTGRAAGLVEHVRDGLFEQTLGNVPARASVHVELQLDQGLAWRDGGWEWRWPTVVAPRYVDGGTADAGRVAVDVADAALPARLSLQLSFGDALTGAVTSPSHTLVVADGVARLPEAAARLDRDVVVRWPVAAPQPGVEVRVGRCGDELVGRLAITPPQAPLPSVGRDVILLLDTSGSMGGRPMTQLREVSEAIVAGLGGQDTLELVSFGGSVQRWRRGPTAMDNAGAAAARAFLASMHASGGTPMDDGVREALAGVRSDAQRQVVLLTDGHIGFEDRVVGLVRAHLPPTSRLHTVGVGDSVNRGLLTRCARAGGGAEIVLGLNDAARTAVDALLARLNGPQVVDVTLSGPALVEAANPGPVDLLTGTPAALHARLRPGLLVVEGRTHAGPWRRELTIADAPDRPELGRLYARDAVAWRELDPPSPARDAAVEALGLRYGVVTSRTTLVGVSVDAVVDPTLPTQQLTVPHELPHGLSVEGLGLRAASAPWAGGAPAPMMAAPGGPPPARAGGRAEARASAPPPAPDLMRAAPKRAKAADTEAEAAEPAPSLFERAKLALGGLLGRRWTVVRVTRLTDRAVLELRAAHGAAWARPATVRVRGRDGVERDAAVDAAPSTADASISAGQIIRLVLLAPDAAAALVDGVWYDLAD
jgi:Ca-activated chloride channel family protein